MTGLYILIVPCLPLSKHAAQLAQTLAPTRPCPEFASTPPSSWQETPSKPHIPYRGDNPSVGKKTGIQVARVKPTADGFEPFQELLSQANRTPPRRKKKSIPREDADSDEEDEENLEEDMDVESPVQYSAATPRATTSARPVSRGASADFDAVPSPRTRKSVEHAGPSRLAMSLTARELLEQDEGEDDGGMDDQYADDFGDEANEQEPAKSPLRGKGKGKAKAVDDQDEEEMEDEIARSLDNSQEDASEEEEEEQSAPPRKKIRSTPAPTATQSKPKSRNRRRTAKRVPYAPLEYWRGEKYVYAPREEGPGRQVPYIKEILRIPKEDPAPRRAGSKRKRARPRSASAPEVVEREVIVEVPADPEAGWDDETDPQAVVLDYRTGTNVTRRVAFTSKMFNPIAAAGGAWFFEKIFGDGDFMAAGQLVIPAKGRKPGKGTKDNTYIFFVVEGAVNVVVCDTSIILASGGMFMVPRGNSYFIENIADRDAKLFFTQARKMRDDDEDEHTPPPARAVSVAMGGARSGSSRGRRQK